MKDQRPYLLRGLLDWILESDCTPYILVDAETAGGDLPADQIQDGRIVLNIAPSAVRHFALGEDVLEFECRFAGVARQLSIPIRAVLAIYARENGAGMAFQATDAPDDPGPDESGPDTPGSGPALRVVK